MRSRLLALAAFLALLSTYLAVPSFALAAQPDAGTQVVAAPTSTGGDDGNVVIDLIGRALGAAKDKNYMILASVALMGLVWFIRREKGMIGKAIPWLTTRWGGWALAFGLAFLGSLADGLMHGSYSLATFLTSIYTAGTAVAGVHVIKDMKAAKQ